MKRLLILGFGLLLGLPPAMAANRHAALKASVAPAAAAADGTAFPPAPTGAYEVNLTWAYTQGSDTATGFDVYRAVSGGASYVLLNTTPVSVSTTAWSDTTVANNTAYSYYVVAVDASGLQSAPSNLFAVTTPNPPAPPASLAGTAAHQ